MAALAAFALSACGSSDVGTGDALDALQTTTDASRLNAEVAVLTSDLPSEPTAAESAQAEASLEKLDARAGDLIAASSSGAGYDEQITAALGQTRGAVNGLVPAVKDPSRLAGARRGAVEKLKESNRRLRASARIAGAGLANDKGDLSASDAKALDATLAEVDKSGEAVSAAGTAVAGSGSAQPAEASSASTGCTVRDRNGRDLTVVVKKGSLPCAQATAVFAQYYSPSTQVEGSGGSATVGEWFCISYSAGQQQTGQAPAVTICDRSRDGAEIATELSGGSSSGSGTGSAAPQTSDPNYEPPCVRGANGAAVPPPGYRYCNTGD